jgi:hypothetical protein
MKFIKVFLTIIICVSTFTLWTTSCRKTEREPKDWIKEDLVFDTMDRLGTVAGFNLNDLYNFIPNGFNRVGGDYLDAASGDAVPSRNNTAVEYYTSGRVNVLNNPDPYWANSYAGIRRANIFLANIGVVPITVQTRQFWKAEARFIRTLLYFELLKRYGGVPLIGDTIFKLDDNLQIPRNNFEQCVNYIVSECVALRDSLRTDAALIDGDWGRITRGAAIALKCRVLLYAASPLYNGGGFEQDAAKKVLTGYLTADVNRWQKVIDAAEEFKSFGYFDLQTTYISIFTTRRNKEIILAKQSGLGTNLEVAQAPVGYGAPAASQGLTSPTQNFVDAFNTDAGLAITDPASGYNAANPYATRDPRMNTILFYNAGPQWLGKVIETFEGGKDKPNVATIPVQTKTGYYLRKFLGDFTTGSTYSNQSHNYPIFRYAEILLNYAEALNEMGRMEDAVVQLNLVRKRAGIKAGANNRYGIKVGVSQIEMREIIRNERRIELSFEEHRFWDVRRWKIADQVLNGPLNGMKITKTGTTYTYQVQQIGTMLFQNRLYHMPIPYDETTKNLKLVQNEGW